MKYVWSIILIISGINIKAQSEPCYNCVKVIFIVDNSGSVSSQMFSDMKSTVDQLSTNYLALNNNLEIAIVQYATLTGAGIDHQYNITVPFTNNAITASNWGRFYNNWNQDHLPGSLAKMRLDGVWNAGGLIDITSENCKIEFILITDALRDSQSWGSCCSDLININFAPNALPNYDEYNNLKYVYNAEFTVIHDPFLSSSAFGAGAAISSVGGNYSGVIDNNPGDPQGSGALPRKYYSGTLLLSQNQIDSIVVEFELEICDTYVFPQSLLLVPNIFTPNGDADNNLFLIDKENIILIEGIIFDRWGIEMTSWNALDYGWNGKTPSGKEAPDGTYYYIIKAKGIDQKEYLEKGFLTLIR